MIDDNGLPILITNQNPQVAQKSCFNLKEQDLSTDPNWRLRRSVFRAGVTLHSIGMIAGITGSIALFCIPKNYVAASLVLTASIALAPKFMQWCSKHLLPMDDKRFYLEQMKIQTRALIVTTLASRRKDKS